ncbi:MAG: aminoglycoside phosphotransferase family protein [Ruminiclostridium sp.]
MIGREAKYVDYIKNRYPQLVISKIEYNLKDGKHNGIVIINDRRVFKFAKYDWSVGFLDNEVSFINSIKRYITISLPRIEVLEKGIAAYNYIKGGPLFRNTLLLMDNKDQELIAEQIGTFLKQLHSISIEGESNKDISICQVCLSREDWLLQYDEIQKKIFQYCDSYTKEYIDQIFKPLLENESFLEFQPTLIHGDLMPYHFLLNKESNRINGIIDFGLSGIGDPAYDVGIILDNLGEVFIKRIGKYYKDIPSLIDRARFYAYTSSFSWAKTISDMITTRDFTQFRVNAKDRDIMPIGSKWW